VDLIELSADGATVLLGTSDGTAMVGPTNATAPTRSVRHPDGVSQTQLSADGTVTLTAGVDSPARLRRVDDGSEIFQVSGAGNHVAMDPVARHVVVADMGGRVDLATVGGGSTNLLAQGAMAPVRASRLTAPCCRSTARTTSSRSGGSRTGSWSSTCAAAGARR
jgi:hypothetical protein